MTPSLDLSRRTLMTGAAGLGVPIEQFDASAGSGAGDDTELLNTAIAWCRKRKRNLVLREGNYLVTRSLDVTADSPGQQLQILGPGAELCRIRHRLREDYPALDMSGNGRGSLIGFAIVAEAGSQASAGVLCAKGRSGSSAGNTITIRGMRIQGGSQPGHASVVIASSDLSRVIDSEVTGEGGGLVMGLAGPEAVSSKFVASSRQRDFTQGYVTRCSVTSDRASPLLFAGGSAISIRDTYVAAIGAGGPPIVAIRSPDKASGNTVWASGLRTENQSQARGVGALHFYSRSVSGSIVGNLITDAEGYAIGSDPGAWIRCYDMNLNTYGAVFSLKGDIRESQVVAGVGSFGEILGQSSDNIFRGRLKRN